VASLLNLEVATPTGLALKTEAASVAAPSVRGEFGVLPGHLPLLAALRCGVLEYVANGKKHVAAIGPGFVEAGPDKVLLLTDMIKLPEDIDLEVAKADYAKANEALRAFAERHEGPEFAELERDKEWAEACIKTHEMASAR
jgi:F-type H+-transporting ATPase subunit epsilon